MLVNGDTTFETNEAFTVHSENASGATISDADGTGTVTNDDAAPSFQLTMSAIAKAMRALPLTPSR